MGIVFGFFYLIMGVYAFAFLDKERLFMARDIMGVKPLWFAYSEDSFAFASEKKVLTEY